jgi:hypothetical protein
MTRDELICFQCGKVIGTKAKTTTVMCPSRPTLHGRDNQWLDFKPAQRHQPHWSAIASAQPW